MNEEKIYPSMVIRIQAEAIELLEKENQELKEELKEYKRLGYKHLQEKNNELEHNWNELKEWLLCMQEVSHLDLKSLQSVLSKMQEIESDKNDN